MGGGHDLVMQAFAHHRREQLGVRQTVDPPAQDDGRDDQWAGAGPAAGLVHPRDGGEAAAGQRPLVSVES